MEKYINHKSNLFIMQRKRAWNPTQWIKNISEWTIFVVMSKFETLTPWPLHRKVADCAVQVERSIIETIVSITNNIGKLRKLYTYYNNSFISITLDHRTRSIDHKYCEQVLLKTKDQKKKILILIMCDYCLWEKIIKRENGHHSIFFLVCPPS